MASEAQPLLRPTSNASHQITHGWLRLPGDVPSLQTTRQKTRQALSSKWGHYFVIFLVSVDICGIFADFLISLYLYEHECCQPTDKYQGWHQAQEALEIISLTFSCLFMVELIASIWAFGFQYGLRP